MRRFGELESAVLDAMWALGRPCTVHEVIAHIPAAPPAYTTAITVMERMRAKGWLARQREGRAYRYEVVYSENDYTAHLMEQALDTSADRAAALLSFAGRLEGAELEELRRALAVDDDDRESP